MKLRIIAVPVGNEIKKFPNDSWHFFSPRVFCRLPSIMTVLKGKYVATHSFVNIPLEHGEDVTIRR